MASPHSFGVPSFDQIWLLALEFQTQVFGVRLDILRGRIVMFLQERINSSAIERHQCLNQMIAVNSGVMIGRRKFAEGSYPELVFVTELPIILGCNPLQLRVSLRGEYGLQHTRQLGGTAQKQVKHSLSIHTNWFGG